MRTEIELTKAGNYTLRSFNDQIKYAGIVDFDGLYRMMTSWFIERKYDFYETLYKDKPPELELEWTASRKVNEFYKYKIEILFHLWDVKEVEVIKEGVKKKMIECRMMVRFVPTLIIDWQDKWKGGWLVDTIWKIYFKNVIYREIELKYGDTLWYHIYSLHAKVKELLGMEAGSNAY
jgi:hypothetical protein